VSLAGLPMVNLDLVPYRELNSAYKSADRELSREVAAGWQKGAEKMDGVTDETLIVLPPVFWTLF